MKLLHEIQTFSPVELFSLYTQYSEVCIEAHENYQKRSLRNKYFIQTSQGIQALTIPLQSGKNNKMPIREVLISYDENWQKQHLNALRTAYGKSPYFEFYFENLESLFLKEYRHLYEFNMTALKMIISFTSLRLKITESDIYVNKETEGVVFMRDKQWPTPVNIEMKNRPYVQVWSEPGFFCKNLSVLDALFCVGPQLIPILKAYHTYCKS